MAAAQPDRENKELRVINAIKQYKQDTTCHFTVRKLSTALNHKYSCIHRYIPRLRA